MTVGEFAQRLRRADFLDGLGIYVDAQQVALAHATKRLFQVKLRHTAVFPLPGVDHPVERRQALAEAVATFAREREVDTRRAYLCLPRAAAAFSRVIFPASARENLAQVLEYEMDRLIPLPRDAVYYDFSARLLGADRLEVLLMCLPRAAVQVHLDALEDAFVRPRGIVLASTAIADYLSFCRGGAGPALGLLVGATEGIEVALVADGRLVASQLLPSGLLRAPGALERSLQRQVAEELLPSEELPIFQWQLTNGTSPTVPPLGEADLLALGRGRLDAPAEFFEQPDPALLPAVGAALDAVREGTVTVREGMRRVNLLPEEGRRDDESSLATGILLAVVVLLSLVWVGSALVKDELLRRQVRERLDAVAPQVHEVKALQNEIDELKKQVYVLTAGDDERVTKLLQEITTLVPLDAYLTSLNLRSGRLTLEGQARSASDLISALGKSKHFKNVAFTSPTTRVGDKERFALAAEIAQ